MQGRGGEGAISHTKTLGKGVEQAGLRKGPLVADGVGWSIQLVSEPRPTRRIPKPRTRTCVVLSVASQGGLSSGYRRTKGPDYR